MSTPAWTRAIGIRSGEARAVGLVALLFAALEAGRGFGEIGADTLVVSRFGADSLPYLFVGLGISTFVAALAYTGALGRLPRVPLLAGLLLGAAGLLAVERAAMATGHRLAVPVTWLTVYAVGSLATTVVWTVAGAVFDARQAKRLFPLCTAAAICGSFVGTLAAGPLARTAGAEALVVAEAVLLALAAALVLAVARSTVVRTPPIARERTVLVHVRAGLDEVRQSPLLRLVSIAYVLFAVLLFSVSYPFLVSASQTFPDEGDLATALGLLSAAVTAVSFLVSVTVANRVYARFGVAGAALLLPVVYLGGFGLWIVAFSFPTAALVRAGQQVTQRGLSNAAWSAFFNVVPLERRAQVLAFVDGVPGQLGTVLSGLLLLAAGTLLTPSQTFWLGAVVALALTALVLAIRRRYADSLLRTLRAGLGEQLLDGGPGLAALTADPAVRSTLTRALDAPEAGVRVMAAELLARTPGPDAAAALTGATSDADAAVRVAALSALEARAGMDAGANVRTAAVDRLADPRAEVRAAAVRLLTERQLRAASADGSATGIEALVDDPSPVVRAAVACALAADGPDARASRIVTALLDGPFVADRLAGLDSVHQLGGGVPYALVERALADPAAAVRAAAVRALGRFTDDDVVVPPTLAALDDEAPAVRAAAMAALAAREPPTPRGQRGLRRWPSSLPHGRRLRVEVEGPVRTALVDWTRARLERATLLRRARTMLSATSDDDQPARPDDRAFLVAVLEHRERHAVDLALEGLDALGVPGAAGVLRRSLRSEQPEVRAQAVEVLDSVGDRRLSGILVRLLEDTEPDRPERAAVLDRLAGDEDSWVATMAARVIGADGGTVEPDPPGGGERVPATSRTLGDLETMLALRRVPLFQELGPEDLQRIAAGATEHVYAPGEALVHEGELGDELIVLVAGSVRVVHTGPDGGERYLRSYSAGDHIGELAVLRARPRAATVVAEAGGVRGLVISGPGLRAILQERPEAAMAMLATLAERISQQ